MPQRRLISALLLAPAIAHAQFTIDHYARVARVTDVRVSPAGDRAVVLVAWPNYDANTWEADIISLDLKTRAQQALTRRKTVSAPRWSPDGRELSFLSTVDGKTQIFVMPASGGEARQVTRSPTGVGTYIWKPDGSSFLFTATAEPPRRNKFADAFEVDGNDYLTLSAPRAARPWTISVKGGEATAIAPGTWSIPALFATIAYAPDGRSILVTRQESAGTRNWEKRSLAMADVTTGATTPIPGIDGKQCGAAWPSPDGRHLLASCPLDGHVKNPTELVVVGTGSTNARRLTGDLDRNFSRGVWRPDSRGIVATAPDATTSGLWEIPLDGAPRKRDVGKVGVGDLDVAADGSIVFIGTEPQRPAEVYVLRPTATAPERITNFHADVAALTLGKLEAISWKSDDGLPLDGVLTFPPDFSPSRTYPLLLNIHGGPWGSSRETFSTRSQLLAGKGFIVFEPNYRGSDNHGARLYSAVYRDHGAGPGRDVMAGMALLKQRPYIDTTRIGVSGWSYGGYMTTWLIGHYQGWKAAMAGAAVIDLVDDYNLNDLSLFIRAYGETLTFPADLALMKEQSPMTYVDSMKTPLLLLSTTGDVRVPVTQSYKLYNALKERGRDVQMKLWPVPGHFPADPYRARDIDRVWADYFVERLK